MKKILLGFIAILLITNAHAQTSNTKPVIANLLVGTYTKKGSKGIYVFNFDTATGKATQLGVTDSCDNPSFLTISKDKDED